MGIDDMGREVSMDKVPKRIASLAASNTEILFALGLGDRIVGVTRCCDYPEEAKEKEQIGGFATVDPEKIVALKPDLVLAFGSVQKDLVTELEGRGRTVFWLCPHTVSDILESFVRIGEITGSSVAAQQLREEVEKRIETVEAKTKNIPEQERPTVFRAMGCDPFGTVGGDSFQTDVFRIAGARNIFSDTKEDYFRLDLDTLPKLDPDIIVACSYHEEETRRRMKDQKGWQDSTAIKMGRMIVFPGDLICRPGPRIVQTIEQLAKEFHPELF